MSDQHYCLRWNNYQSNMTSVFHQLLETESFVDVTLACNDLSLKAHKVVLSACSSYFQKLLMENPCKHPTIIMPPDVGFADLKFIIEFVYKGEIDISQEELQSLLRTADQLKIKGLCEVPGDYDDTDGIDGDDGHCSTVALEAKATYSSVAYKRQTGQPPDVKRFKSSHSSSSSFGHVKSKYYSHHQTRPLNDLGLSSCVTTGSSTAVAGISTKKELCPTRTTTTFEREEEKSGCEAEGQAVPTVPSAARAADDQAGSGDGEGNAKETPAEEREGGCSSNDSDGHRNSGEEGEEEEDDDRREEHGAGGGDTRRRARSSSHLPGGTSSNNNGGGGGGNGGGSGAGTARKQPKGLLVNVKVDERDQGEEQHQRPNGERDKREHNDNEQEKNQRDQKPVNMTSHGIVSGAGQHLTFSQFGVDTEDFPPEPPAPSAIPVGHVVDMPEHSPTRTFFSTSTPVHRTDISDSTKYTLEIKKEADIKFETLRSYDQDSLMDMESHMSGPDRSVDSHDEMQTMMVHSEDFKTMMAGMSSRLDVNTGELLDIKNNGHTEGIHSAHRGHGGGPKTWTQEDMEAALDALRNHNMSLTKASATYGIPSTTLWQRAHRLGIDTPKKEGPTKSWTEENLNSALDALRTGTISANKASKAFGIPSSTLYKIARREGIRLAAPFNAAPTTWTPEDLEKALESIRTGQTSVQKASTEFGIPTGTLYGRCKREGIELSRSNPTPWSEDAMGEALEAVRLGHMSINQAAIHYNLPYSSLYGRFKRGLRYDSGDLELSQDGQSQMLDQHSTFGNTMEYHHQQQLHPQQHQQQEMQYHQNHQGS